MEHNLKYYSVENGYCRVYYTCKNKLDQKLLYCMQLEFKDDFRLYRCSKDGEPDQERNQDSFDNIELPDSKESTALELIEYLNNRV